jgi:hypothetical protein
MHKLYVFVLFFIIFVAAIFTASEVKAITVTDPPTPIEYAPVFISGFQVTNQLDFVELYNESSDPVDLSAWSVQYPSIIPGQMCVVALRDWVVPTSYVLAVADAGTSAALADDNGNVRIYGSCERSLASDFYVNLLNGGEVQETISPSSGIFVRKGLTKTYRTNKFSTDFTAVNRSLYAGAWYSPPESSMLQISEILVNSRNCSPLEVSVDCSDYLKVFNPTDATIDLSQYRIRNGYFGQSPTSSNTTYMEGVLDPGHFAVIQTTITNSSSWLWLEDIYGIKKYDNTVQDYPDGSSDSKKGQAWAYDSSDGAWKWTSKPVPLDSPSVFPLLVEPSVEVVSTPAPCAEGQYRSEETHRCRSVVSEVASLIPCGPGQERNPTTNRCRSTSAVLGVSDLTPCKEGQERNPETNRCRNIAGTVPAAEYQPQQVSENSNNIVLWVSIAAVGLIALGYALWEWRVEVLRVVNRLSSFIKPAR